MRAFFATAVLSCALGCVANGEEGSESTYGAESAPRWKVLNVQYEVQKTGYWCGPASTRIALSTHIAPPSQAALAGQLGTTTDGTNWIGQVTKTLNDDLGDAIYVTRELPDDPPTAAQKDQFWADIVRSIDTNYVVVANIVAPPSNHPPGYPNNQTIYHYLTIIGYNPDTWQVYIADPANFGGHQFYWLGFDQMATLVPPKGYATAIPKGTCGGGSGTTIGAIDTKYRALGGCGSVLGRPITNETIAPDGVGRYNVFEHGSIYWTEKLGAHEVHGRIRDEWKVTGWESGTLGYPVSDETVTPDGIGRYNVFERGSIYWTEKTDAHEVHGKIRDAWADSGWEKGPLGYPISDEHDAPGGRQSDFEHGAIVWNASTGSTSIVSK